MNVVVIRRPREDARSKTGLGRYADSIECNLESAGEPFSVVEADITLNQGLLHCLHKGVLTPMGQVRRMCRGKDVTIHATDELCGVFFPLIRGRRILTIHHVVKDDEGRGRLYNAIWSIATRTSIRFADDIIAISPNTAEDVKLVFHPKASVQVVFNKPSDYYHRDPSVPREMVVGVVAELIARKNVSESIEAFRILSTMAGMDYVKMKICGRGLEKDNLMRMVHNVGLDDRIEFIDGLSDEEMFCFYNSISLLFNTSLHEGVGMVTLEANLCGTPALCLKHADIPSEVTEASVKCDNAQDMAYQAYALLTDQGLYEEVSGKSIDAAKRFGDGFSETMMRIYKSS